MKLPHIKTPCRDCPFRTDIGKGWLGEQRTAAILAADSFVCHKQPGMQCAGHMLINGNDNAFVRLASMLDITLELSGREQVFASEEACIEHHKRAEPQHETRSVEPAYCIDVSATGDTVWVTAADGSCVGRFSKRFGIDVHRTVTEQIAGAEQCLHCTHEPAGEQEWRVFREAVLRHHGIDVPGNTLSF